MNKRFVERKTSGYVAKKDSIYPRWKRELSQLPGIEGEVIGWEGPAIDRLAELEEENEQLRNAENKLHDKDGCGDQKIAKRKAANQKAND